MERIQRLVRSLRTARAAELPQDANAAVSTLLPLVMKNESKIVSELLQSSDFDVNHRIGGKRTLLHIAANVGAYDCLVILIKRDADVNSQDKSGVTPLQLAARNGHVKCIQKLLESKANIEISNSDGMTALHWIASNGRTELLIEILPYVKNIDIEGFNGQTPLHLACLTGHKTTVQKLIDNGANFEKLDQRGYNPLMYACSHGQAEIVHILLSKGAQISNSFDNVSPLQIALENGHKEVCFVLIENNIRLLESLLVLAQGASISEDKIISVLEFLASKSDNYHRSILIRLSEHSKTVGLELLSASSDYELTQQRFFKSVSLLCTIISSKTLTSRPRTESAPNYMRSRLDSTSARVLRTLTSSSSTTVKRFEPPISEMNEIFSDLWSSLEHWFDLIKDEIHKSPQIRKSSNGEVDPSLAIENTEDCENLDTRSIASKLVRSKPVEVSVRPNSIASLESLRMSQPAVEFNLNRQCGEHGMNRGLYREISRRLYQSFNSNQDHELNEENGSDSSLDHTPSNGNAPSPVYRNARHSQDSDNVSLSPSPTSHRESENSLSLDVIASDALQSEATVSSPNTDALGSDLEREYLASFAIDNSESNEESESSVAVVGSANAEIRVQRCEEGVSEAELSQRQNSLRNYPSVSRSISYTYAIGENIAQENFTLTEGIRSCGLSQSFSRSLSTERNSLESSQNSTKEHEESSIGSSKGSMIERFADRLCAVVHGYHLLSYCRPYRESDRKFGLRMSKFDDFVEKNEEVLQLFIARRPKLIFDHFQFVLHNPLVLQKYLPVIHQQPFNERLEWFYDNLHKDQNPDRPVFDEKSQMMISRESLLLSSCENMLKKDGDALKKSLAVQFEGEVGMGEGVVKEWFDLLFKEVLNPDYALFTLSADGSTFQPNSNSAVNPDHLNYFLFAGKMMGVAMFHKKLISASFTRSFYKHILGIPVSYQDVASMDPEYAKNLQWILDNDISSLGLEIDFAVETREFGETNFVPLKPGGKDILVTEENKEEYVQLAADMKMTKAIKPQIYSFLEGFHEFIPHSLVSLFDEYELELVLSGIPEIDCDDWERNTIYQGGITADSDTVKWLWEIIREYDQKNRTLLLQFVTGSSRVPWGGFAALLGASGLQKFTISSAGTGENSLPSASTCFNLLKLPEYKTKQELANKLMTTLKHGTAGFEFA